MIYVKDFPALAAFYIDVLRLKPIEGTRSESWVEFDAGAVRLALHAIPAHIAAGIEIASPPQAREDTPIKLIFEVDDPDAERLRLEALGVIVLPRPWGGLDFLDPEGNIFSLWPV